MDFGKFWLQSNNGKEQIGEIKQGIRREQIDTKLKLIKEKKYGSKWIHIYKKEN